MSLAGTPGPRKTSVGPWLVKCFSVWCSCDVADPLDDHGDCLMK